MGTRVTVGFEEGTTEGVDPAEVGTKDTEGSLLDWLGCGTPVPVGCSDGTPESGDRLMEGPLDTVGAMDGGPNTWLEGLTVGTDDPLGRAVSDGEEVTDGFGTKESMVGAFNGVGALL